MYGKIIFLVMGNRTFICKQCGFLKRGIDHGREASHPIYTHCGEHLSPLSHEQSIAARLIDSNERVTWFEKGAYILKGDKKKKRWLPVIDEEDIQSAILQEKNHVKIDNKYFESKAEGIFEKLVEQYIDANFSFKNNIPDKYLGVELNLIAKLMIISEQVSGPNYSLENEEYDQSELLNIGMNKINDGYLELFKDQNFVNYLFEKLEEESIPQIKREKMKVVLDAMAGYGYPYLKDNIKFLEYFKDYIFDDWDKNYGSLWFWHFPKALFLDKQRGYFKKETSQNDWDYEMSIYDCEGDISKIINPCEFIKFIKEIESI